MRGEKGEGEGEWVLFVGLGAVEADPAREGGLILRRRRESIASFLVCWRCELTSPLFFSPCEDDEEEEAITASKHFSAPPSSSSPALPT